MFNYNSTRAKKARLSVKISDSFIKLAQIVLILSLAAAIFCIIFGKSFGSLILIISIFCYALIFVKKHALTRIPIENDSSIDGCLSDEVLGNLPDNPTPSDIAKAISDAPSERFLSLRFGVSASFLEQTAPNLTTDAILQKSLELARQLDAKIISGGIIALAMVALTPNYETILAQIKLSFDDLLAGVKWHDRLTAKVQELQEPILTGGVARDWSFGFSPLLSRYARNISSEIISRGGRTMSSELPSRSAIVTQIIDIFAKQGRQNVAIVGQNGAGKTSVVHDFAEKIINASDKSIPDNLRFNQVFLLDASLLISSAPNSGQLENLLSAIFSEAYSAKNIILCLDDAQLFFESGTGSVDISNLLLPILNGGALRLILTLNEQKLLEINSRNPALVNSLNRINIKQADRGETFAAMEDRVIQLEHTDKVVFNYQALREVYDLSQKYIYDLVLPGRALKLLEMSARYPEKYGRLNFVTPKSVADCIENTFGVQVGGHINDNSEKQTLLDLETLIHQRMIDQEQAVSVVANALRRARTGVNNSKKPIGTFLFLGPTGVGKTELAKALAAIYFKDEDNMIRIDLNQYVDSSDVKKLTADGAENPTSLTAQAMKHPFSVVLFDEIEKAHPAVLSALLQLLDEGVLRDTLGREVSFRDSIIIATSNAGANQIRDMVDQGENLVNHTTEFINNLISAGLFTPEFINRFDEIVLFKPLGAKELLQIADLMITGINKTLASQKITVKVDDAAKALLVKNGYDPRMGARPMRRIIQRTIENEVSKQLLAGTAQIGDTIFISAEDVNRNLTTAN
jgi:ATP-dependent Clp protease ATP-binding subunit ClpC